MHCVSNRILVVRMQSVRVGDGAVGPLTRTVERSEPLEEMRLIETSPAQKKTRLSNVL